MPSLERLALVRPADAYRPNLENQRVRKRVLSVLDWANDRLSERTPHQVHHSILSGVFGQQQNPLSAYLRRTLLIQVGQYQPTVSSFSYLLNGDGYRTLRAQLADDPTAPAVQTDLQRLRTRHAVELSSGSFVYHRAADRDWHPLQNLPRLDKPAFWAPFLPFDYDFAACAPTILSQLAAAHGYTGVLQQPIADYLADPAALRRHVADLTGLGLPDAKRLINSLFNGARLQRSPQCAAYRLLGYDYDAMTRLMEDSQVRQLRLAVTGVWRWLGLAGRTRFSTGREKWSLYFACERRVMDAVIEFLNERHIRHFTEHDGFRTDREVDVTELLGRVRARTGFDLDLKRVS